MTVARTSDFKSTPMVVPMNLVLSDAETLLWEEQEAQMLEEEQKLWIHSRFAWLSEFHCGSLLGDGFPVSSPDFHTPSDLVQVEDGDTTAISPVPSLASPRKQKNMACVSTSKPSIQCLLL